MRILHYLPGLPPVRGGGLIKYALDLAEAQSENDQIFLLIPGSISIRRKRRCKISIQFAGMWKNISLYKIRNPLPIPMANGILDIEEFTLPCIEGIYGKFLENVQPNIIHMHTLMGIHKQFLVEARALKIPILFTAHDYFGLCPTVNLFHKDSVCTRPYEDCAGCSKNAFSEKRLLLEQSAVYKKYRSSGFLIRLMQTNIFKGHLSNLRSSQPDMERVSALKKNEAAVSYNNSQSCGYKQDYRKLQKYYREMFSNITCFHFNSDISKQIYEQNLGSLVGQVIYISNNSISDKRTLHESTGKLKIGFLGGDTVFKGLQRLRRAIGEIYDSGMKEIELQVYGSLIREELPFCKYYDTFTEKERDKVFAGMDILAVPSSWMETFGMVVLEALSYGVPVMVSDKAGAKGILEQSSLELGVILPDTHEAWKEYIEEIYCDRGKIRQYSENIGKESLELRYSVHVDVIYHLYGECMNNEYANSENIYLSYFKREE